MPIVGLDNSDMDSFSTPDEKKSSILSGAGTFAATQPPRLVKAVMSQLDMQDGTPASPDPSALLPLTSG